MADSALTPSGLDTILAIARRRAWIVVLMFIGPFAAVVSVVSFLPNIYRSTAIILVDRQQVPEAFVRPTVTSGLETRLQTITQEILSRSRLEDLITRFGLYSDLKTRISPEAVIERMRQDIQLEIKGVDPRGRGNATIAFAISYRGSNPRTVALVTNTLASFYIEENLKVREKQASGTAQFLRVQLDETKTRLDEQEAKVSAFKTRSMGELPQQLEANLSVLERLHMQLRLNAETQIKVMERRDALMKHVTEEDSVATGAVAPTGPDATAVRLEKLRHELTALRSQFNDKYPDVVRVKTEIATLERNLADSPAAPPSQDPRPPAASSPARRAVAEIDGEIKALKADEKQLRAAIAAYQRRIENTPRREQEFQVLSRDYQNTRELYATLLKRYEEAQLAESMEQRQKGEQFRILDPALPSAEPAAPKRPRLLLMGLVLSLGAAIAGAGLAEKLDTSFHTGDALRRFAAVPVLVSIPRIASEADARRGRRRLRLGAALAAAGTIVLLVGGYVLARGNEQLVWLLSRGGI